MSEHPNSLITIFLKHPVAANLLMALMIFSGFWGLQRLNTQFFPEFELGIISISTPWHGASAEDIKTGIIEPFEQELRNVDNVKSMQSIAKNNHALIILEFREKTDMGIAMDQVKEKIGGIRNFPRDAETPIISLNNIFDPIANLVISGPSLEELRHYADEIKLDLLNRGISRINTLGLPDDSLSIEIEPQTLYQHGISYPEVAHALQSQNQDRPAGTLGRDRVSKTLRSLNERTEEQALLQQRLHISASGDTIRLGEIAQVKRKPLDDQVLITYRGNPAVELQLQRAKHENALTRAKILQQWLDEVSPTLPESVDVFVYNEAWEMLWERIILLADNGITGLMLVISILFLFLNSRVAFWVTVGIPVSFLATMAVLVFFGGSINMVSLFALIMALGIVVDDAIVVGENTLYRLQQGESAVDAAVNAGHRMLAPVIASSLTTMAAFFPLMLITGPIGRILFDIPLVIICVICASLVESFLVLPGHLHHSFQRNQAEQPSPMRQKLDGAFEHFQLQIFKPFLERALKHKGTTITAALGAFVVAMALVISGRIPFNFFPSPDDTLINLHLRFLAGTSPSERSRVLDLITQQLEKTDEYFGENNIQHTLIYDNYDKIDPIPEHGPRFATVTVELQNPDQRHYSNQAFMDHWRHLIPPQPSVESLSIDTPQAGPPGKDIDLRLYGRDSTQTLKQAAEDLKMALAEYPGISDVEDDLPYGQPQLIFKLTPAGLTQGLNYDDVARQLQTGFDGALAQIVHDNLSELEVRVRLPNARRNDATLLHNFPIKLPSGNVAPLGALAEFELRSSLDQMKHLDGRLSVQVTANVNSAINNTNAILADLYAHKLPEILHEYGLQYTVEGPLEDQKTTLADMKQGLLYAFITVYIILAWVFSSYGWPFVVLAAIPFGLIGAILGHFVLNIEFTILSLFGAFGLSGIVINDSIILLTTFRELRQEGMAIFEAAVEAACQRLRAVTLTSCTTIAGLTPLLFETSVQAQFLIPMATSISFGLAFSTILVLVVIPALLLLFEQTKQRLFSRHDHHKDHPRLNSSTT